MKQADGVVNVDEMPAIQEKREGGVQMNKRIKQAISAIVIIIAVLFTFEAVAATEAPMIVRKIVEHREFFRNIKGFREYRVCDVQMLSSSTRYERGNETKEKLIGLVLYDNTGVSHTVIFDHDTQRVVKWLNSKIEPRYIRLKNMGESIKITDAIRIAEAAYGRHEGIRTQIAGSMHKKNEEKSTVLVNVLITQQESGESDMKTELNKIRKQVKENEMEGIYASYDSGELIKTYRSQVDGSTTSPSNFV